MSHQKKPFAYVPSLDSAMIVPVVLALGLDTIWYEVPGPCLTFVEAVVMTDWPAVNVVEFPGLVVADEELDCADSLACGVIGRDGVGVGGRRVKGEVSE